MSENIDNWQPLTPEEVRNLFAGLPVPWWIAGGWAIELFLERQTRSHGDIDVLILRDDQLDVQDFLSDWDLHKSQQPALKPWPKGEFLNPGVNDIWCRRTPDSPWSLQLMLFDTQNSSWIFRRDRTITGPIASIGRTTESGIPYLSPEIQLLYKARSETLDKNDSDFRVCAPRLQPQAQVWLLSCLTKRFPDGHKWIEWIKELRAQPSGRGDAEDCPPHQ